MKCPKCDYISFDYNETCPKCGNPLVTEREEMNLPDYKPAPPFLLGALTSEGEGLSGMPEAEESGPGPSPQEELMASLDNLSEAQTAPEGSEAQEINFDIEPELETAETEETDADTQTDEGPQPLEFDIEAEQPEDESLEFNLEAESPSIEEDQLELSPDTPRKSPEQFEMDSDQTEEKTVQPESPESEAPVFELEDFEPQSEAVKEPKTDEEELSMDALLDPSPPDEKTAEIQAETPEKSESDQPSTEKAPEQADELLIDLDEIEPLELEIEPDETDDKENT